MKDGKRYDTRNMGAFDICSGKIIAWRDYYHLDASILASLTAAH
jgi:limonene-1,2-epoxide hydrolase